MNFQCPSCDQWLAPGAKTCRCGWKRNEDRVPSGVVNKKLGYVQCDWETDHDRCTNRGTLSHSKSGVPIYCKWHYEVAKTQKNPYEELAIAEAEEFCRRNGLRTVEEKRKWLREKTKVRMQ